MFPPFYDGRLLELPRDVTLDDTGRTFFYFEQNDRERDVYDLTVLH
jgi:hypothetical protein